ncbi:MAG: hypothetical protein GQ582_01290 [Methyloprofundus sp.]|nr:hypothetical protein [Methyloprofundus sp.]
MARIIFFGLVLINIIFFFWEYRKGAPEIYLPPSFENHADSTRYAEKIVLLSEVAKQKPVILVAEKPHEAVANKVVEQEPQEIVADAKLQKIATTEALLNKVAEQEPQKVAVGEELQKLAPVETVKENAEVLLSEAAKQEPKTVVVGEELQELTSAETVKESAEVLLNDVAEQGGQEVAAGEELQKLAAVETVKENTEVLLSEAAEQEPHKVAVGEELQKLAPVETVKENTEVLLSEAAKQEPQTVVAGEELQELAAVEVVKESTEVLLGEVTEQASQEVIVGEQPKNIELIELTEEGKEALLPASLVEKATLPIVVESASIALMPVKPNNRIEACYQLKTGKYSEAKISQKIKRKGFQLDIFEQQQHAVNHTYWVLTAAEASFKKAKVIERKIKRLGITDYWLVIKGPLRWRISLGLFSSMERANKAKEQLAEQTQLELDIMPRDQAITVTHIKVSAAKDKSMQVFTKRFSKLIDHELDCYNGEF